MFVVFMCDMQHTLITVFNLLPVYCYWLYYN